MAELRLVLTVLPVGPRGADTIKPGTTRHFALQITAGFDTRTADPPAHAMLLQLWPWTLAAATKEVQVFLANDSGTPTDLGKVTLTPPAASAFATKLREEIHGQYAEAMTRANLDVRWRFPGESSPVKPDEDFPARVQYLATLPGEISSRLLATLYVALPVDKLFTFDMSGKPTPIAKTLWVAPVTVTAASKTSTLTGEPSKLGGNPALLTQKYTPVDGLDVAAFGPGCALQDVIQVKADGPFDLAGYWTEVSHGDPRLTRLDDFLEAVLDQFSELDAVTAAKVLEEVEIVRTGGPEQMRPEMATDLMDLWRVDALIARLDEPAVKDGILKLANALLGKDEDLRFLTTKIDAHALNPPADAKQLFDHVSRLAAMLGIQDETFRTVLALVAGRAGSAAAAAWIVSVMSTLLETTVPATAGQEKSTNVLRLAWRFDRAPNDASDPRTIAERRVSLAEIIVRARFEAGEVRLVLETLATRPNTNNPADQFLREKAHERLMKRWPDRFRPLFVAALASSNLASPPHDVKALKPGADTAKNFTNLHFDEAWPPKAAPRRDLPGHGLPLLLGDVKHRLAHQPERPSMAVQGSPYSDVAGLCLFVRRGTSKEDVKTRPWRLVTGGACIAGSLGDDFFTPSVPQEQWLDRPLAIPIRPVFQQQVVRADLIYYGEPVVTRDPLDRGYADSEVTTEDRLFTRAYTFEALGAFRGHKQLDAAARATAGPILRYGDWYQFASGVIDQASGLPPQVAVAAAPWQLDVTKIVDRTDALPKQSDSLPFPRTVAVGELSVVRVENGKPDVWPAAVPDVTLRCREWWSALHPAIEQVPTLLLSTFATVLAPDRFTIHVTPPSIEEHTLVPWAAPALGDANGDPIREAVIKSYATLLSERRTLAAKDPTTAPSDVKLLHDSAVTAIGVVVRMANSAGVVTEIARRSFELTDSGAFRKNPLEIVTTAAPEMDDGQFPTPVVTGTRLEVSVPAGRFAVLELSPLVTLDNFKRFHETLFADLVQPADAWLNFRAFRASSVLLEAAIDKLPEVNRLFEGLALEEVPTEAAPVVNEPGPKPPTVVLGGPIAVKFKAPSALKYLPFVDRFTLRRERWAWRNRPTLVREQVAKASGAERRRLFASGPPVDAFDPKKRDASDSVTQWETVAGLDRGFVDRGDYRERWPRQMPADEGAVGGPLGEALLLLDDRDAVSAADYLRYSLSVRSRYAGLLKTPQTDATARRRIISRSRAERLRTPKILAVIPLTRSFDPIADSATDEAPKAARTTPFLVILDEVWFREYGVGERLQVRVTLENLDIGELDERKQSLQEDEIIGRPYRIGPLPDAHLALPADGEPYGKKRYFEQSLKTSAEDNKQPLVFDAFGPYGFSLDASPDEALANASAFVVPLDRKIGSHWAAFVRFARVLEHPASSDPTTRLDRISDLSDVHAVYTLPDSATLATVKRGHEPLMIMKAPSGKDEVMIGAGVTWTLDPVTLPDDPEEPEKARRNKNSAAASRYRYFLMISRLVQSAAHPEPIELPQAMWRLRPLGPPSGHIPPGARAIVFRADSAACPAEQLVGSLTMVDGQSYVGRVIEVLVNGHYPGESRLDGQLSIRKFWNGVLTLGEDATHDTAGMIRRVSDRFDMVRGTSN